jgi:hypothetical protein
MYDNILSDNQKELLPFIQSFQREYYLVGGTAIALQIGHRESIDFDMFKLGNVNKVKITQRLNDLGWTYQLLYTNAESFHILCNGVKITFFQYPFKIPAKLAFQDIKMPNLLHLAAMKAYALGRRAKWKDYVDLYFIFKNHHSLDEVVTKAQEVFQSLFSPKLFKQQLCYFNDIDYGEEVTYCIDPITDDEIKSYLTEISTNSL